MTGAGNYDKYAQQYMALANVYIWRYGSFPLVDRDILLPINLLWLFRINVLLR